MPQTASPLRYPGGKSQLYRFIVHLLQLNSVNEMYLEPFAGGSGLPMKLLLEGKVNNVWINDYDQAIYSVWYAILWHHEELIEQIEKVPFDYYTGHTISPKFSIDYWKKQKRCYSKLKDLGFSMKLAFATLFLNRTNTSGIINGGPVGGLNQAGLTQIYARFNKKTLINKIILINNVKSHIRLTHENALNLIPSINNTVNKENSFIFFDPPYYEQGKNLYLSSFNHSGHEALASEILRLTDYKWITTYDKSTQIEDLYFKNGQNFEYNIRYSANNKKRGHAPELMFASPKLKIDSFDNVHLTSL